jgi:phosphorylase kinase alpha/beta subunit
LAVGELDPLNRRLCSEKKPDVVVQVVIIAESEDIKGKLAAHDILVQTVAEVAPIEVQPARVLSHLYTYLGSFELIFTSSESVTSFIEQGEIGN